MRRDPPGDRNSTRRTGLVRVVIVRLAHVLAMAVAVGGAALLWAAVGTAARSGDKGAVVPLCRAYEWLFWGSLGVLAMTGVGNLGALGRGLPGPGTGWGALLGLKLLLVATFLVFSAVRTVVVADGRPGSRALELSYGITTVWLLGVVAVAEVLAHG